MENIENYRIKHGDDHKQVKKRVTGIEKLVIMIRDYLLENSGETLSLRHIKLLQENDLFMMSII